MNPIQLGILVFGAILVGVLVMSLIHIYNALVDLRNQIDRAWANIEVILKQRHDELPQLITVIQQFTQYERATLDRLIEARTRYGSASSINDKVKAASEVSSALQGVLVVAEGYPELKSSDQFVHFQQRISALENQIADRRELFNETVTRFNVRIQQIPDVFLASALGYSKTDLYRISHAEKKMPSLKMKLSA